MSSRPSKLYFIGVASPRDEAIDRAPGGDNGYIGLSYTRNNIDAFCERYAEMRKNGDTIRTVFEHEKDQPSGEVYMLFRTDRDQLGIIGTVDGRTPAGRAIIDNWMQQKHLGLSIGGMTLFNENTGRVAMKAIDHLGLVEDPEYGNEGTWVKRFSPSLAVISHHFNEEFLPSVKYVAPYDRLVLNEIGDVKNLTGHLNNNDGAVSSDYTLYRTQYSRQTPTQVISLRMSEQPAPTTNPVAAPAAPASLPSPPPPQQQQQNAVPATPPPPKHDPMDTSAGATTTSSDGGRTQSAKRKADTQLNPEEQLYQMMSEAMGMPVEEARDYVRQTKTLKAGGIKPSDIPKVVETAGKFEQMQREEAERKKKEFEEATQKARVSLFSGFAGGMDDAQKAEMSQLLNSLPADERTNKMLAIITEANSKLSTQNQRVAQEKFDHQQKMKQAFSQVLDTSTSSAQQQPHTFLPNASPPPPPSQPSLGFDYKKYYEDNMRTQQPSLGGQQQTSPITKVDVSEWDTVLNGKPFNHDLADMLAKSQGMDPRQAKSLSIIRHIAHKVKSSGTLCDSKDKYCGVDGRFMNHDIPLDISQFPDAQNSPTWKGFYSLNFK